MKIKLRKLFAVTAAALCLMLLAACDKKEKVDYEALKTDLIGVWCDVNGPQYVEEAGKSYYRLYEFTPDGSVIYHMPQDGIPIFYEQTYMLIDDLLDVEGSKCRISIENDTLTMSYDAGSSTYRRMDIPEICDYGVWCINNELYDEQVAYLKSPEAEGVGMRDAVTLADGSEEDSSEEAAE